MNELFFLKHCLPSLSNVFTLQEIFPPLKWDSLRLDGSLHSEHGDDEAYQDGDHDCSLYSMPDVVMQCIFESFDLRERCLASQVNNILLCLFFCLHFFLCSLL